MRWAGYSPSDVAAAHSTPPFDRATMDGYAVMAGDMASVGPTRTLSVIEEVFAGSVPQEEACLTARLCRLPPARACPRGPIPS